MKIDTLPLFPVWIADLLGSALMIAFSFACVHLARRLRATDQDNAVWTYLLWLCYGLAAFAVSRAVGHIARRLLIAAGQQAAWEMLRPFSGAVNTLMFAVVTSVTLFFERLWKIYQKIQADKTALEEAHGQLLCLNRNLAGLVAERTQELSASEHKYRSIFEASQDMIVVVRPTGTIVDVNAAGVKMLGLDVSATSPGVAKFQDFLCRPEEWQELEAAFRRQGYVGNREIRLNRRGGGTLDALLSGGSALEASGRLEDSVHFIVKDISDLKALQRQLLQADKLASVGQLAAGIAHEINNPMGMILGYTQLLLREEPDGTGRYEDLKTIEKHARTCKTIVSDLLNFARRGRTHKEPADLHAVVDEVVSVLAHHFTLDGIRLVKDYDGTVPVMHFDIEKIRQVFMNLLMNARQAIGRQGEIRIRTRHEPAAGRVMIAVTDTGCGIDRQHVARVFDPFFTTKPTGEGTGLGLSVSYGIVSDHGGDITVESELGAGSTFTVQLPTPAAEVPAGK